MRRITPRQEALLAAISSAFAGVDVHWDEEHGVASSLRGPLVSGAISDADAPFRKFLDDYAEVFGPPDLTSNLRLLRDRTDDIGWRHLEYQMTHPLPRGAQIPVRSSRYGAPRLRRISTRAGDSLKSSQAAGMRYRTCRPHDGRQGAAREPVARRGNRSGLYLARRTHAGASRGIISCDAATSHGAASLEGRVPLVLDYLRLRPDGPRGTRRSTDWSDSARPRTGVRRRAERRTLPGDPDANERGSGRHRIGFGLDAAGRPVYGAFAEDRSRIGTNTYRLRDTTHARDIVTYDAAASASFSDSYEIADGIRNATLPKSEDTDGNKTWSTTAATTQDADRTASQQPEVDAHFHVGEITSGTTRWPGRGQAGTTESIPIHRFLRARR